MNIYPLSQKTVDTDVSIKTRQPQLADALQQNETPFNTDTGAFQIVGTNMEVSKASGSPEGEVIQDSSDLQQMRSTSKQKPVCM